MGSKAKDQIAAVAFIAAIMSAFATFIVLCYPSTSNDAVPAAARILSGGTSHRGGRIQQPREMRQPRLLSHLSGAHSSSAPADSDANIRRRSNAVAKTVSNPRALTTWNRKGEYFEKEARIVNGQEVGKGRYPYMAALMLNDGYGGYEQYASDAKLTGGDDDKVAGDDKFNDDKFNDDKFNDDKFNDDNRFDGDDKVQEKDDDDWFDDDWFDAKWWSSFTGFGRKYKSPYFDRSQGVKVLDYEDVTFIVDVQGSRKSSNVMCGASLVMPDVVLSAAHCEHIADYVHLGRHDIQSNRETFETCEIIEKVIHPLYDDEESSYDFALFKLGCESKAPVIKLNDDPTVPEDGVELAVMGWGTTQNDGPSSNVPLKARVDYMTNKKCQQRYGYGAVSEDMLCAWRQDEDSCQGDSGGPLILQGKSAKEDKLVGVVSWGVECAHDYYPGVYARVSTAIDWIRGEMCSLSSTKC